MSERIENRGDKISREKLTLVAFSGLPGTGKSTLASAVAASMGRPHVSVDPIEVAMWKAGIDRQQPTGLAAYVVAETIAREQLAVGLDVIVDAVNAVDIARQMWRDLAAEFSASLFFVECTVADLQEHRRRLEERRRPEGFPEPTWTQVEESRRTFDEWTDDRLVVDCLEPLDANVCRVVDHIQKRSA